MFCLVVHKITTGLQNVKARMIRRPKHVVRAGKEREFLLVYHKEEYQIESF
jgi:hypothetical protein